MKKVITTMLVAAMVLSMAVPTSAATITRKKSTGTSASTTKVSGDYSLKMVDKTLQFIRGGKVVSSIETKDGKITLRKSSAGGISVVFTDANGKRRNITLGKQDSVSLSGTFTQVSVDKALGSSFEVEMEKGSKVTNFYAKGAAKVTLNGSVTTLNVTSSNANVAANGTVSRAYAVNKKAITGMSSGKITQTSTGTSASGSVNTSTGSSSSSNTTVNSGSGSSGSSSSGSSGIIINGGGSNNGGNTTSKKNPTVSYKTSVLPTYDEGTVLTNAMLEQFGLKATYGNATVAGTFSWTTANTKVLKGTYSYSVTFTPKDTKTYNTVRTSVKIEGKAVQKAQTLAEAKAAIEAALKSSGFTNETTEAQIQKLADDCITSSDIQAVAKVTIVKATETAEGTIKGTIELTKGTEKETVTVDLKIAQLSALQAAKAEVEAALDSFVATKETTKDDIVAALDTIVKKYTSVDISVGDVTVVEADKKVSVVVTLKEGEATDTVSKTWTYTEQASALEEAKAKVVAALDGITPSKDIDKDAIEAALADIKTEYPTVEITVGDVVPNETAKTVSVEVSLKEGNKTDKVAKTWDYSGQAVAKKPTFTKHPADSITNTDVTLSKDTPVTLEVAANVDGSTEGVTYQWYRSTSSLVENTEKRVAIEGATSATYTLAPEDEGNFYFFAEAIHTVGNTKDSSFSNNVLLKVTVPEGSAVEKPVFTTNLGDKKESLAVGVQKVLTVDTKAVTLPTKTTYQWYMSTDPKNPLNGTPIPNATGKSYTAKNDTIGVTSYYCVATNTTTDKVDFNNRTATSQYYTITVTSSIGFSAAPVDKGTEGTTAIDVTFTKDITGLSAENFKVEGKKDSATDEAGKKATPTITVDRVESFSDNLKKYTLYVSGIDLDGVAVVSVTPPAGISISDPKTREVAIKAPTAPVEVLTVKGFAVSDKNDQGETTQLKVTFDKVVPAADAIPGNYEVQMGDPAGAITINGAKVDPADDHSVLLDVTLNSTVTDLEATLTEANGTALKAEDQKKVAVTRDKKAPTVTSINLGTNNAQIKLAMSEPLADANLTPGDFTLVDADGKAIPGAPTIDAAEIDASTNNTMIVLTASAAVDAPQLKYTVGTAINDKAAAPNALAAFTAPIEGTVLPETLEIQAVEVTAADKAVVKMNAPIEVDPAANLDTLFVAKDQKTGANLEILSVVKTTTSRLRATQSINGFIITFKTPLPAGAVVVISINPSATDVADKIAIAGKPDAKLPVNQPPVVAPEVKAVSATVADVEVAGKKGTKLQAPVDVEITLADGTFKALGQNDDVSGWFKNLPAALTAVVKTAVTEGEKTVTITIDGTPSEAKAEAMKIEIPKTAIVDAAENLTVTNNAKAKFAIVDDTPAGTTADDELANIKFAGDKATLPAGTTDAKAEVEAELVKLAQAQVDAGYEVSVDTVVASTYNTSTKVWTGKFVVTNKTDGTDKATDANPRTITVTISAAPAVDAPDITGATAAAGSAVGTTKIDGMTADSGNSFKVVVGTATTTTPKVGDSVPAGATTYTAGTDITGVDTTTNKYVALYEADSNNKVVKFKEFELNAQQIKAATPITDGIDLTKATTLEAVNFTASQAATLPATTALSPVVPGVDTLSIEWKDKSNATISGGTVTPTAGDTITAIVTVTPDADHTFESDYSGTITEPSTATSANGIVSNGNLVITVEYSVN